MRYVIAFLIRCYQYTLSPDHGIVSFFYPHGFCRFYPTCSAYAREAVLSHGTSGILLSIGRLLRCHPWSAGGIDPVPDTRKNI